ncbi:hypothetical protein C623_0234650 [Bacillus thuringiensis serovar aizawai str. Hu4-2]|nr:hypothetical protein C623_0234650 [Bacillus thuringiensis serovar aizawai str. Hu4-2]
MNIEEAYAKLYKSLCAKGKDNVYRRKHGGNLIYVKGE